MIFRLEMFCEVAFCLKAKIARYTMKWPNICVRAHAEKRQLLKVQMIEPRANERSLTVFAKPTASCSVCRIARTRSGRGHDRECKLQLLFLKNNAKIFSVYTPHVATKKTNWPWRLHTHLYCELLERETRRLL